MADMGRCVSASSGSTRHGREFYEDLPDLRHTLDDVMAEGDRVAVRLTARGTHGGDFQGAQPTGKRMTFTGMRFYRGLTGSTPARRRPPPAGASRP